LLKELNLLLKTLQKVILDGQLKANAGLVIDRVLLIAAQL